MKAEEGDWQKFAQWLNDLRMAVNGSAGSKASSRLLFRGQGSSEWPLETTLERNGPKKMSVSQYYRLITSIGPSVGTFTEANVPEYNPELLKGFSGGVESFFDGNRFPSGTDYEYMAYLRHHGFPSPLLDWSRSPYVAAFFAFRHENPGQEKRSIYAYCENLTGAKGGGGWGADHPRSWAIRSQSPPALPPTVSLYGLRKPGWQQLAFRFPSICV